ncbi:MAG: VPGUxxT family thioredoxin-like (seleno)protein, type 2 [Bacteroidota bacterium]
MTGFLLVFTHLMLMTGLPAFNSPEKNDPPVELGKVNWLRDIDAAVQRAEREDKPIFILFQEVPGCATCRNYGKGVLSHPLIVEAIESLFVPLAIYNNREGEDAKVLRSFREPAWNNPVVRIVDFSRNNLIPRISGDYSPKRLVQAMTLALKSRQLAVPNYLTLLEMELMAEDRGTETATFSMYCFWTGEKHLGAIDGVVETAPGFMGGREVVKVEYDPFVVSYEELLSQAKDYSCASHVYSLDDSQKEIAAKKIGKKSVSDAESFRLDREPKYYLSKTHYQYVPMTPLQASRVNSLIGERKSPLAFLSPRQQEMAKYIRAHSQQQWRSQIGQDFYKAWTEVSRRVWRP